MVMDWCATQDGNLVFFLINRLRQNDECNIRRFLVGMNSDVPV